MNLVFLIYCRGHKDIVYEHDDTCVKKSLEYLIHQLHGHKDIVYEHDDTRVKKSLEYLIHQLHEYHGGLVRTNELITNS